MSKKNGIEVQTRDGPFYAERIARLVHSDTKTQKGLREFLLRYEADSLYYVWRSIERDAQRMRVTEDSVRAYLPSSQRKGVTSDYLYGAYVFPAPTF